MSIKIRLLTIIMIGTTLGMTGDKWKLEFTKDGISVYTKEISGSTFKAFMAEGDIQAPIEKVNSILYDTPGQVKWMPDCIVSYDLRNDPANVFISYNETKAPFVNNRDVIVETVITKNKNSIIHESRAIDRPDLVPEYNGKVRIRNMRARWELISSGRSTHVIYEVIADPGGIIPGWLTNAASKDVPYKTLLGLKKMAEGR